MIRYEVLQGQHIRGSLPNNSYPNASFMWIGTQYDERPYLRIATPNQPVAHAILRLYDYYSRLKTTEAIYLKRVTEAWDNTLTYTNRPPEVEPLYTLYPVVLGDKWIELDITDVVNSWVNDDNNYGFVIYGSPIGTATALGNIYHSNPDFHPHLMVEPSLPSLEESKVINLTGTRVKYIGDGTTATFTIPFEYISKSYIIVKVNGTVNTTFTFPTDYQITLDSIPTEGSEIVIMRDTPKQERLVNFQETSTLNAETLDLDSTQLLHINQEAVYDGSKEYVDDALADYSALLNNSEIVEEGSGVNGSYIRWANGLQICWLTTSTRQAFINIANWRISGSSPRVHQDLSTNIYLWDWVLPASFVGTTYVAIASGRIEDAGGDFSGMNTVWVSSRTASTVTFQISTLLSAPVALSSCMRYAIGRWK